MSTVFQGGGSGWVGQAKNKSWFGILEAYKMLDSCWTILSETARFAQTLLDNLDDDWDREEDEDQE